MKRSIIEARQLNKSYIVGKQGLNVLKNIDLDIYNGDFTVIMGSSGSGKSTLLYSLSSMDQPTSGKVSLLGKDITTLKEKEIASVRKRDISFIFQSIHLLPDINIFENIACIGYGVHPKKEVNEKTLELLKRFHLDDKQHHFPSELSGGEAQRIAIARALINDSSIIFGDEPTGALNSSAGKDVLDILSELNEEGKSIVMVTHDIKACARGNRLLYLKDGRIDGEMNLGRYQEEEQVKREEIIFQFLKEHNW